MASKKKISKFMDNRSKGMIVFSAAIIAFPAFFFGVFWAAGMAFSTSLPLSIITPAIIYLLFRFYDSDLVRNEQINRRDNTIKRQKEEIQVHKEAKKFFKDERDHVLRKLDNIRKNQRGHTQKRYNVKYEKFRWIVMNENGDGKIYRKRTVEALEPLYFISCTSKPHPLATEIRGFSEVLPKIINCKDCRVDTIPHKIEGRRLEYLVMFSPPLQKGEKITFEQTSEWKEYFKGLVTEGYDELEFMTEDKPYYDEMDLDISVEVSKKIVDVKCEATTSEDVLERCNDNKKGDRSVWKLHQKKINRSNKPVKIQIEKNKNPNS